MPATTRTARQATTTLPTPRRFLRCVACGTIKKERGYALCAECFRLNGHLDRCLFTHLARHAEREGAQYSYRKHPEFERACRVYERRRERARALADVESCLPEYQPRDVDARDRYRHEEYDGLGAYDLDDLLDWQMYGADLPEPERPQHRAASVAEIERWDARVDDWAEAHGRCLTDPPSPEIRPWGYAMEIAGALVWTDDVA